MEKTVQALVERTSVAEKLVDFLQKTTSEESRKRKLDSAWESVSGTMWGADRLRESLDKRAWELKERERSFFMFEEKRKRELAFEEDDMSLKRARFFDEFRVREEELDLRVVAVNERAERLEVAEAAVRDTRRRASERLKRIEADWESLRLDRESLLEREKKVGVIIEALDGRISAVEKKEEEFELFQERKTREIKLKEENLDNKWQELAEKITLADEKLKDNRFMERIELAENRLDGVRAKMDEKFEVIACSGSAYWESLALSVKEADLIRESVENKLEELRKTEMEFNSFQEEKNRELASKEKQLELMGQELVKDVKLRNEQLIEQEESWHRLLERLELANDHLEGLRRSVNGRFEEVGLKLRELASKEELLEVRCKEVYGDAKLRNKELKEREQLGHKLLERLMLAKDTVEGLKREVNERHEENHKRETELDSLRDWVEKKMDEADLKAREVQGSEQRIAEKEARLISKETEIQEKEARLISDETEFQEKEACLISKEAEFQEKEARLISKEAEIQEKEARLISEETEVQEREARLIFKEAEFQEKEARLISKETEIQEKEARLISEQTEFQEKEARLISKEAEFQEKEARMISKETELHEKEARLISKETELQEKEAHLISKETELHEKEKYFFVWQKELEDKQKEVEDRFKKLILKETELNSLRDWVEKKMDEADLKAREVEEREQRIAEKEVHLITKITELQEKEAHLISKETELQQKEAHLISKETELHEMENYFCLWQKELEDKQKEVDSGWELNEQKLKKLDSREKNLNSVREFIRNCFKEHQAIKRKLLTEKDLVEKKASDLVLREQHLNLALEDIELREKHAVKLLELKEVQHSTNVFNTPLEIEPHESSDLKFMVRMDGKTLQMFLNDAEKDFESMGDEIFKVLHLSSDPAKLVLDAMVGFYPPRLRKEDAEFNVRRTCITLLQQLLKMSPKIKTNVREEAIEVAMSWKSSMKGSGENGRSMEVLGFLFLLSAFDIVSCFEEDEISSFVRMVVEQHREAFGLHCVLNSAKSI